MPPSRPDRDLAEETSHRASTRPNSLTVDLPGEVLRRLRAEAARRGVPVQTLIAETLERDFPAGAAEPPALSFIGIAQARDDLSETYKQIRRELAAGRARKA
jgi:hypothetical protein